MLGVYESIDKEITLQCKKLEQRGVPLDLSELNLRIFRKTQELNCLKESFNQRFGFIPKFSDEATWRRVYEVTTGMGMPSLSTNYILSDNHTKIYMSRRTVEALKEYCPELVEIYKGLQLERLLSQMGKVVSSKVECNGKVYTKPKYKIDPKSGQIFLRDPNLRTWNRDLKGTIRESDSSFLLVWYDVLDLTVLENLSQDPVLGSDLESLDPYKTMACRFWETSTPSQEQIFIARLAFSLFCNGVKPEKFWNAINTTYSEQCILSGEDAGRLYEKFTKHYIVSCEYFDRVSMAGAALWSEFGRCGMGSSSRCYAMTATSTDITKLGFLGVLEDSRLERLGVKPLALVSYKMLLSIPCDQDIDQVKGYVLSDFLGAYTKYQLRVCMTTGSSWGECGPVGQAPDLE